MDILLENFTALAKQGIAHFSLTVENMIELTEEQRKVHKTIGQGYRSNFVLLTELAHSSLVNAILKRLSESAPSVTLHFLPLYAHGVLNYEGKLGKKQVEYWKDTHKSINLECVFCFQVYLNPMLLMLIGPL